MLLYSVIKIWTIAATTAAAGPTAAGPTASLTAATASTTATAAAADASCGSLWHPTEASFTSIFNGPYFQGSIFSRFHISTTSKKTSKWHLLMNFNRSQVNNT